MSDQDAAPVRDAPAGDAPAREGPRDAPRDSSRPESSGEAPEENPTPEDGPEQPEDRRFDQAGRNPLSSSGGTGGSGTAHAARRTFAAGRAGRSISFATDGQYFEGNYFISQSSGGGPAVLQGPVHAEELDRLAGVYCETSGYQRMKRRLRERGLLVLCGECGSGRTATALSLLSELTGNRVIRLDPGGRVREIEEVTGGHGHLLEIVPEAEGAEAATPERDGARGPGSGARSRPPGAVLTELHLDRLRGKLAEAGAYGIVLVESGDLADRMLRGRYGVYCPPPPAEQVLLRHLRVLLKNEPPEALGKALELAAGPDVKEALGLAELRPAEAARLADHLARCLRGELTHRQLLDDCATFVRAQARIWFAGADNPGTLPEALPSLSTSAFRIAVAVFNGSAHSLTAEAGERLAAEMAATLDPEASVGRRLFGTHAEVRPAAARAVVEDTELDLGDARVPVRAISFQGDALPTAVLREVWHGYHNARGPLVRWLRSLCSDPRPQLWVRASVAAGVLCSWDWVHGAGELIGPLARSDGAVQRMAAATALAEAAREPAVRPAVQALLKEWAVCGEPELVSTTALAHGYGMAAGSVSASLDALAVLVRDGDDPDLTALASFSVARLLAGPEPETVVRRLADWLLSGRTETADLVLLSMIKALGTRATFLWGLADTAEPAAGHGRKPLVLAVPAAHPQLAGALAALVRHTLSTARSGQAALDTLGTLLRRSAGDAEQRELACDLLRRIAVERRDRDRLRHLLARLVRDRDEPLDKDDARLMWDAVGEGGGR
ncbi:hypothetical protein [Streptomyces sp. MNU89]|uniref:hypothetical protein n=1 Tax=Streptomyces sp. MNU89 TaxID=2560025 RepID=UPI001E4F8CBE|nr:hypothetical protein [Streptomyces sp. MNU89]MCC9741444.1 hypothetical protein [Streptomyces sp. MNU89]